MCKGKPKYKSLEELNEIIKEPTYRCVSCNDKFEIGNCKGDIKCPNCGWLNII